MRGPTVAFLVLAVLGCTQPTRQPDPITYASGEVVQTYARPGASLRDPEHRDSQRVSIWYPVASDAVETPRIIGPAGHPYFISGQAADGAPFAAQGRRPLIVISHGFGGSARQMAWLGTSLAREGYVVVAVDHPGNNGNDDRTPLGALLYWERADDIRYAIDGILGDPEWGPRIDPERIGAIGYSMGGASVLMELGARPDLQSLARYCARSLRDLLCGDTISDGDYGTVNRRQVLQSSPDVRRSVGTQAASRRDDRIDAAVLIAPALGAVLANDSLRAVDRPVLIVQGLADQTTPPDQNADQFAGQLPSARLVRLEGVDHNAFLGTCGEAARTRYAPLCANDANREQAHQDAIREITGFFASVFGER